MTQKQILETVLKELVTIKKHMPNGELQALIDDMKDIILAIHKIIENKNELI